MLGSFHFPFLGQFDQKTKKISSHFWKNGDFLYKKQTNRTADFFWFFWSLWPKNEKHAMEWTKQKSLNFMHGLISPIEAIFLKVNTVLQTLLNNIKFFYPNVPQNRVTNIRKLTWCHTVLLLKSLSFYGLKNI